MKTFNEIEAETGDKSYKAGLVELSNYLNGTIGFSEKESIIISTQTEKSVIENKVLELLKKADESLEKPGENRVDIENILTNIWKCKIITGENQSSDFKEALTHFVEGIYKDSFHFFLELIQNADDASKNSKNGRLHIVLTKEKTIQFKYDDRGFNFTDLYAITSLGNSTKKAQLNNNPDIGEKGIGFKSIFAIAKKVNIKSKYYSFAIEADKDNLQKTLVPIEIDLDHTSEDDYTTILTLELREDLKRNTSFFDDIHNWMLSNVECNDYANPFMFLKNIKKVSYQNENMEEEHSAPIEIKRESIINEDCCCKETVGKNEYFIYKKEMEFKKEAILSRWPHLKDQLKFEAEDYCIKREMQVAFPILSPKEENKQMPEVPKGKFYSYLPTNITFEFPVFINLDVHLTASRGNISASDFAKGSLWNQQVLEELPKFLKAAYLYIIDSQENETLKEQELLKNIREHLYLYIPIKDIKDKVSDTTNSRDAEQGDIDNQKKIIEGISEQLESFANTLKADCPIILSIKNRFCNIENVKLILNEVNNCSSKSVYNYNYNAIDYLYNFMEKACEKVEYPKTNKWNRLLYNLLKNESIPSDRIYDAYDIVVGENGFKDYWENNSSDKTVKKNVINQLIEEIIKKNKTDDGYPKIEIIPFEDTNEDGFTWGVLGDFDGKTIFFHSDNPSVVEDKINSVYVKQFSKEDSFNYDNMQSILTKYYGINKYDLLVYYQKCIKEFDKLNSESANSFIKKTFGYYKKEENCYKIKEQDSKIKEYFSQFILPWKNYLEYLRDSGVCEAYVNLLNAEDNGLQKWEIDNKYEIFEQADKEKYIKYLTWLGLKCKPEVVIDSNDNNKNILDEYTFGMINSDVCSKKITINKTTREIKSEGAVLSRYLIEFLNGKEIVNKLSKEYLKDIIGKMLSVTNYEFLDKNIISKINTAVSDLNIIENERPQIKDSKFCLISTEGIDNIANKIGAISCKDEELKEKIINSFRYNDTEFIKDLRMLKIMNSVFNVDYRWGWGEKDKAKELSLGAFLSCYKDLDSLSYLMKKGYIIKALVKFEAINEEMLLFLKNIGIEINNVDSNIPEVAVVNSEQMTEPVITFDKSNYTDGIRYLVKQPNKYPKSGVLIIILEQIMKYRLSLVQKKEIQDYFGELLENIPVAIQADIMGEQQYCQGVFFEYHDNNIRQAKESIKSIWDKDILNDLCKSYTLINNEVMEGYGYTCPICGKKSKAALSGLKFKRYKQNNENTPYLYIVSCLDCCTMLTYAKSISILNFDEKIKTFDTCYCTDDRHIKNHSQMMTVDLLIEMWDGKIKVYPMKMSYLNMVLYKKMARM